MMSADVRRLLWVRALRAFGDGYVSLLLPVYLLALGLSPFEVGVITTGTLLGSGVLTLVVGLHAHRYRYRTLLLAATGRGFCRHAQSVERRRQRLSAARAGGTRPYRSRQAANGDVRALQPGR